MSLLHHFGQVKRKYEPYVSPIPGFDLKKGIISTTKLRDVEISIEGKTIYQTDYKTDKGDISSKSLRKHYSTAVFRPLDDVHTIPSCFYEYHSAYIFTTLTETFSKCLAVVREKIENALWKTIDCCPFVNIMDLLILKHADTDSHIEHLEKLIIGLIDDNKTLQTKINSLEQQMSLFKKREERIRQTQSLTAAEQVLFDLD